MLKINCLVFFTFLSLLVSPLLAIAATPKADFKIDFERISQSPAVTMITFDASSSKIDRKNKLVDYKWLINGLEIDSGTNTKEFHVIEATTDVIGERVVNQRVLKLAFKKEGIYLISLQVEDDLGQVSTPIAYSMIFDNGLVLDILSPLEIMDGVSYYCTVHRHLIAPGVYPYVPNPVPADDWCPVWFNSVWPPVFNWVITSPYASGTLNNNPYREDVDMVLNLISYLCRVPYLQVMLPPSQGLNVNERLPTHVWCDAWYQHVRP